MPRAERLMNLLDHLRANEIQTVDQLAASFRVSERTMRRDLAALRERGVPISGDAGPGGGVRLERDRGVTSVHLSVSEVVTLWLTAKLSQGSRELPWSSAANSALAKLLASLPRERCQELRALCKRVIVGEPASGRVVASSGKHPPELLRIFEEAFTARCGLGFHYCDRENVPTVRNVEPHGLLVQLPVWYILAWDVCKQEPRMFRMDRISKPRLLKETHFSPRAEVIWAQLPPECSWQPLVR
jgi:predicted DNA-binding transcriptional regulator YafY